MVDEKMNQRRALEIAVGACNSVAAITERITTDGAEVDVGTTQSCPVDDLVGSMKLDLPTC